MKLMYIIALGMLCDIYVSGDQFIIGDGDQ